nr:hypothetical protein CFP56_11482 [Quercus suber]
MSSLSRCIFSWARHHSVAFVRNSERSRCRRRGTKEALKPACPVEFPKHHRESRSVISTASPYSRSGKLSGNPTLPCRTHASAGRPLLAQVMPLLGNGLEIVATTEESDLPIIDGSDTLPSVERLRRA